MRRRGRALALLGGGLLVLWFGAVWALSSMALQPPWYVWTPGAPALPKRPDATFWHGVDGDPGREFGLDFEEVAFAAEDGATLRGWLVPGEVGQRLGVVLVHGGGADRREYLRHLPVFSGGGWPVLLFDCREHGLSDGEGRGISFGAREHRDVSSAAVWLRDAGQLEQVAVVGTSQGGASVLLAAARDRRIDAVIAENPFTTLRALLWSGAAQLPLPLRWPFAELVRLRTYGSGPQPIDVVDRIAPRPLLLIHGRGDRLIPFEQSQQLYARAGEPKQLWLVDGADHTQSYDVAPEEYSRRVRTFLSALE